MATAEEVEDVLHGLVARLHGLDAGVRDRHAVDRTLSCHVPDLDLVYAARLVDGAVAGVTTRPQEPAQVRLSVGSDDLLALADGRLSLPAAWAAGRLRVEASLLDLLRLRTLL